MYYGDEIGMGDNIHLGDRNGVRTPMQWNADRNAGFSKADPSKLYLPVIFDSIYGYHATNVEAQVQTPSSLAHWMKHMISIRKKHPAFGRGTLTFLRPRNDKVLVYLRQNLNETLLLVHNLSGSAQAVELDLGRFAGAAPIELFAETRFPAIGESPYMLSLAPYGYYWFRLRQAAREDAVYGIEGSVI
jgi:maltose alpha-D-glucosyltransferase/alpha-amylase